MAGATTEGGHGGTTHRYKVVTVQMIVASSLHGPSQLKSGAWTPGCSLPGIHGYGEACKNPGTGPGSPLPPEASGPDCAASRRTDGCGSYEPVRYGSFHRPASGCDVPPANDPSLYGCCCGFFVPVWGGEILISHSP